MPMGKRKDIKSIAGQKFGRLTVIRELPIYVSPKGYTASVWLCRCDCGNTVNVRRASLTGGLTVSCKCLQREHHPKKHGMSKEKVFTTWCKMRSRCERRSDASFKDYGGRGIRVCNRWRVFKNFFEDMGHPPTPDHTIERINNNGPYSPNNCRWATMDEQRLNTRKTIKITVEGVTKCLAEWSRIYEINYGTLLYRIMHRGLKPPELFSPP